MESFDGVLLLSFSVVIVVVSCSVVLSLVTLDTLALCSLFRLSSVVVFVFSGSLLVSSTLFVIASSICASSLVLCTILGLLYLWVVK